MPIIKSAKKRVRTAEKAAIRNAKTKRSLKTALKAFGVVAAAGATAAVIAEKHSAAVSNVDKAAKKNLIHKNKAARLKSKLARDAKAAGAKPTAKATGKPGKPAKPAAKKTATKPAAAKKPAAPKSTTGKTAAKKPAAKK